MISTTRLTRRSRFTLAVLLMALLVTVQQTATAQEGHWVTAWGCGPQLTEDRNLPPVSLSHSTLRQYVHASQEGSMVRVRFSNAYGTEPVPIVAAHIAMSAGSGSAGTGEIDPDTDTALAFSGAPGTVIPPGEVVYSDPVKFTLPPTAEVAISTFLGEVSESVVNGHPGGRANAFIVAGNEVSAASLPSGAKTRHWYYITGIEVLAPASSHTVVVFGDSITDGYGTFDGNNRWPDFLARRLSTDPSTEHVSVANMGIGGNAVFGGLGPAGRDRFDRDVLDQNGVKWAIIFIGVNDIGSGGNQTLAQNIINEFTTFANKAHAKNILIYGATITPFGGNGYYSTEHEAARQTVNSWIRTNELFDASIDLDAAIRDPANPLYILPAYNNDNLHPNIAGYEALANYIDLTLFAP